MINKRILPLFATSLLALSSQAQQVDFNIASRKAAEVTAINFTPVGVPQGNCYQFQLGELEITLETSGKDQIFKSNWFKQGIQQGDRSISSQGRQRPTPTHHPRFKAWTSFSPCLP